jgi:hypothetical protein
MDIERAVELGWGQEDAPTFVAWYKALEALCLARTGWDLSDWPDWDFAAAFDDGMTVEEAFEMWVEDTLEV